MTQTSYPQAGYFDAVTLPDSGPYNSNEWAGMLATMQRVGGVITTTPLQVDTAFDDLGVYYAVDNQLEVTSPGVATIQIDTGAGAVGGIFFGNDAAVTLTVPVGRTNDLIVVRQNYDAATYVPPASVDAAEEVPPDTARITRVTALVNDATLATYWDIPLADFTTDGAGAVTLNSDDREWADAETKTMFIPPRVGRNETGGSEIVVTTGSGGAGTYSDTPQIVLADAIVSYGAGSIIIPQDFISTMTVRAMVESSANGNMYIRTLAKYGACGDAGATSENSGWQTIALTSAPPAFDCINSYAPSAPAADDFFVALCERDATGGDDTIVGAVWFLGFIVNYLGWNRQ